MITVGFRPVSSPFANPHRLWSWMGPGMSSSVYGNAQQVPFFWKEKRIFLNFFLNFLHATD
jgi:hypothetical protein